MVSSSSSSSSPSCFSICASCKRKENTVYKKAEELTILCGIDICLICYDSKNNLTFWPADQPEKVRDMAQRFIQLPETVRCKRSVSVHDILEATGSSIFNANSQNNPNWQKEKRQKTIKSTTSTFNPDDYSSQRLKEALISLQLKLRSIHEPKPMKEHHQQQQLSTVSSQPVTTNQDWCPSNQDYYQQQQQSSTMESEPVLTNQDWSTLNQDYNQQEQQLSTILSEPVLMNQDWSTLNQDYNQQEQQWCMSPSEHALRDQDWSNLNQDWCILKQDYNQQQQQLMSTIPLETVPTNQDRLTNEEYAAMMRGEYSWNNQGLGHEQLLQELSATPWEPIPTNQDYNQQEQELSTISLETVPRNQDLGQQQEQEQEQEQELSAISMEVVPRNQDLVSPPVNDQLRDEVEDWFVRNIGFSIATSPIKPNFDCIDFEY